MLDYNVGKQQQKYRKSHFKSEDRKLKKKLKCAHSSAVLSKTVVRHKNNEKKYIANPLWFTLDIFAYTQILLHSDCLWIIRVHDKWRKGKRDNNNNDWITTKIQGSRDSS